MDDDADDDMGEVAAVIEWNENPSSVREKVQMEHGSSTTHKDSSDSDRSIELRRSKF